MEIEIINLYSNMAMPKTKLIGDHGQSFLLKSKNENILLDVGTSGKKLLHNMKELGIDPNDITLLIISHGHYDHTGGLPEFLDARTTEEPLRVLAHPKILAKRRIKVAFIKIKSKMPELSAKQKAKMVFDFEKNPRKINEYIRTSGEITDRPYRQGIEPRMQSKVEGTFTTDMVPDDVSVYVETKEGQVIITGCGHAGILNICKNAKESSEKPLKAIVGGTHMVRYTKEEVLETGKQLTQKFDDPELYLNHCTDKLPVKILKMTPTIDILREKYGKNKVKNCCVGTRLTFNV
ncbi:MAG: MBL fold metallo-hydrolase [Candidatus Heimdallarchaeota archaeon]|nr:MBL fold metallo-hydrolase [Candidatus Heimdallarchaeota archaeon]